MYLSTRLSAPCCSTVAADIEQRHGVECEAYLVVLGFRGSRGCLEVLEVLAHKKGTYLLDPRREKIRVFSSQDAFSLYQRSIYVSSGAGIRPVILHHLQNLISIFLSPS